MQRIPTICAALPLVAALASGCAILEPGGGSSGGDATLGDAIVAARADSSTKVKRMDVGYTNPPPVVVETEVAVPLAPAEPPPPPVPRGPKPPRVPQPDDHPLFGLVATGGFLGGSQYDGFGGFGLTGGNFNTWNVRWDVLALANSVSFAGESRLGHAFVDAVDLELDVTARWYLTPQHTTMGAYAIVGGGTGTLFWDYANRLPVVRDGVETTVGDDRLNHFDLFGGAGLSLLQTRHVHVGANAVGGVRMYGWHTNQGFRNDQLPTTGFGRIVVEMNYRL